MIPFKIMLTLPHLNSEQTISASNWLILTSPQQTPLFISAKEIIISVKISKLLEETSLYSIKMSQKKPNNSNALVILVTLSSASDKVIIIIIMILI